ncbi:MAG: nuclear transport factor 2 family protein [Flavobacteriales bacterium]|nr:nuclear transport factor 2 family protein [Flavobacteriales bacterium]MBP9079734.1 nuclear transport factor 2 family protein [Flavobacteriales bacterium]
MHPQERLIRDCYAAFNAGQYERIPAYFAQDVEWPNMLEGTTLRGPSAVVAYWIQLREVHRHTYDVKHFQLKPSGTVVVSLLRTVHSTGGEMISQGLIRHVFEFRNGLVSKMHVLL